jgi:hypothetical protein
MSAVPSYWDHRRGDSTHFAATPWPKRWSPKESYRGLVIERVSEREWVLSTAVLHGRRERPEHQIIRRLGTYKRLTDAFDAARVAAE